MNIEALQTRHPSSGEDAAPRVVSCRKFYDRESLMAYDPESEDWQKQLARRYDTHFEIAQVLNNVEDVPMSTYETFDMKVTPYLAQLMDRDDPNCPIRLQYLPSMKESLSVRMEHTLADELGEAEHTVPGTSVVHRYPRRVLFLVTTQCASFCRYCTRSRIVSHSGERAIGRADLDASMAYIAGNKEIEDVLLSGGDPLVFTDRKLDELLGRIRSEAPHVRFLRIGSRLPVQLPTRITPELCAVIEKHDVQMVNIHINHSKEITPLLRSRIRMLRRTGTMLGNQSVLLKGINDDVQVLRDLFMDCVSMGVRPYYLYQNDQTLQGAHFTVPLSRMLELYEGVRGWISGPAVPTFVIDGLGGLGKMPVIPTYVEEREGHIECRNYKQERVRMDYLRDGAKI
ncbi:KamA family radical SAM protein [Lysobacter niastensis]|uniref:KamA family radical SAM protein n=1 Tax=Lysobacter niastensis TaxID=380629 RepID=A0ABS0B294_9GAMM|nr:KamA family radical SAM protein [Lysobacter niastensis]MBF6022606.1 KamA family radical SAM protein [Lysobacter niastensis]